MAILKDTETEQIRQLVKACLLEISKLKIENKKYQKTSNADINYVKSQLNEKDQQILQYEKLIMEKEKEIKDLNELIKEKDFQIKHNEKIRLYFDALTARPKKDLTSFQSQVYQLMGNEKTTISDHYNKITDVFTELSLDNFNSILRNLERKGYVKSFKEKNDILWQKVDK